MALLRAGYKRGAGPCTERGPRGSAEAHAPGSRQNEKRSRARDPRAPCRCRTGAAGSGAGPPRSMPPLFATRAAERHIETVRDRRSQQALGWQLGVPAPGCLARGEHGAGGGCVPPAQPGVPVRGSPRRCHVLCAAGREVAARGTAGTPGPRVGTAQGGLTVLTRVEGTL